MSEEEIDQLVELLKHEEVIWDDIGHPYRTITRIVEGHQVPYEDDPEPSRCACFSNGKYIALYNVDIDELYIKRKINWNE